MTDFTLGKKFSFSDKGINPLVRMGKVRKVNV